MIAYDQERIVIDWNRMQTFAALAIPLPKHGQHTYAPVKLEEKDWSRVPIRKTAEYRKLRYREQPRLLEAWEEEFFNVLENMTLAEYSEVVHGMEEGTPKTGVHNDIHQPSLLKQTGYDQELNLDAARFDEE